MGAFSGKVVSIVGAGTPGNMGQVMARRFAEEGATVVVSGRDNDALGRFASEIGGHWLHCDLCDRSSISAMFEQHVAQFERVDVAINATGWGLLTPLTETTEAELDRMVDLQFKGPFIWLQHLVKVMTAQGGGSIIQISSATAKIMLDNHAAYMGTKAGIDHVIRTVANEYGEVGIRANSISPGLTESPMTSEALKSEALKQEFAKCYPLGRYGTSEDIAEAALFLASDRCFMTGENLQVNGGLCLRRNPRANELQAAMVAAGEIPG
ncbi:short-chain dehydrogenase/reductase SDR [Luminiphilus syltensis NOR5-1B]|uniref:Short-chain dehydrogenase/reductase SDR n=1 Tax=Luminiphilus syltensis NOR5-1B TaxID=565045 RepID=B8KSP5_9GAMM|nr:SDR family oxidoreductase [Luminiphilus syltensis]EED35076.1 short-chain dehydrogenase/reductase SDR [Luminiphilus syltensis NOR5-1B]